MGLLGDIKEVAELVQKMDNVELYGEILKLQEGALRELEEQQRLHDRIAELQERLDVGDRLTFEDDAYWLEGDDGAEDGPFCSAGTRTSSSSGCTGSTMSDAGSAERARLEPTSDAPNAPSQSAVDTPQALTAPRPEPPDVSASFRPRGPLGDLA